MVRAQLALQVRQHVPELLLRLGAIAAGRQLLGDTEAGVQRVRVVMPQRVLLAGQGPPVVLEVLAEVARAAGVARRRADGLARVFSQ